MEGRGEGGGVGSGVMASFTVTNIGINQHIHSPARLKGLGPTALLEVEVEVEVAMSAWQLCRRDEGWRVERGERREESVQTQRKGRGTGGT